MGHELWAMNTEVFKAFSCFFFPWNFQGFLMAKNQEKTLRFTMKIL